MILVGWNFPQRFFFATKSLLHTLVAIASLGYANASDSTSVESGILDVSNELATYNSCLSLARVYPEQGFKAAEGWIELGGGEPAAHCQAIALIGLGDAEEAARRLDKMARSSIQPDNLRAGMLAQAGQAWLLAGMLEQANVAYTVALSLNPSDPDLYIDRSMVLAAAKNYWQAIDDLNVALEKDAQNADALALRASAYRHVEAQELAMHDVVAAVSIDPDNVNALLERGILYRLANQLARARRDWEHIVEVDPESRAAHFARLNLRRLAPKNDR